MFYESFTINDLCINKAERIILRSKRVQNLYYCGDFLLQVEKEKLLFLIKHRIKIRRKNGFSHRLPEDFIFRLGDIDYSIVKNRFKRYKNTIDNSKLYSVTYCGDIDDPDFAYSLGKCSLVFPTKKILARWKLMV